MKLFWIVLTTAVLSIPAMAHQGGGHGRKGPCAKAGMNKTVRQALKAERKKFRTSTVAPLKTALQTARKAFRTAVLDSKVSDADVAAAATKLGDARGEMVAARKTFLAKMARTHFSKDVKAGLRCLSKRGKRMQRHRRGRRGNRGRRGPR